MQMCINIYRCHLPPAGSPNQIRFIEFQSKFLNPNRDRTCWFRTDIIFRGLFPHHWYWTWFCGHRIYTDIVLYISLLMCARLVQHYIECCHFPLKKRKQGKLRSDCCEMRPKCLPKCWSYPERKGMVSSCKVSPAVFGSWIISFCLWIQISQWNLCEFRFIWGLAEPEGNGWDI